jgi:hypothetical protein
MYRTYDYGVSFHSEEDSVWSKTLSGEDHLKGKPNATRSKGRKWKKARLALCLTKSLIIPYIKPNSTCTEPSTITFVLQALIMLTVLR